MTIQSAFILAYMAHLELQGEGTFSDERLNDPIKYPVAARAGFGNQQRRFISRRRFATLLDVVNHYSGFRKLSLTEREKKDLVEYLKSL